MEYYSDKINKLIEELGRLPGVGRKSAQRLAFQHIAGAAFGVVSAMILYDRRGGYA